MHNSSFYIQVTNYFKGWRQADIEQLWVGTFEGELMMVCMDTMVYVNTR